MNLSESVFTALQGLAANKLRSALTLLGIIIGVLAVILGTAIGQGSRQQVLQFIQALGSNTITVFPGQQRRGAILGGMGSMQTLKLEDADAVRENCPHVLAVVPQVSRPAQVKFGHTNTSTSIVCTTPAYPSVRNFTVERGRFFNDKEVRGMRKVCIVGKTAAQNLFGDSTPLGKSLRIKGINFRIIGLMALKGSAMFGDPDDQIYIPVTTGLRLVFGLEYITSITAQAASVEATPEAVSEIETVLRKQHRISPSGDLDFIVRTQAEFMQTQEQAGQTFTFLLTGIAAVALLVGGIGIMNIMLVTVTERTREIGIRKAVGAKHGDILFQFLIESTTLSVVGGLVGIGGGFAVSHFVGARMGWPIVVSPLWVAIAFFSSATIGVFFGIYPAWKAARLNPVEALRYE